MRNERVALPIQAMLVKSTLALPGLLATSVMTPALNSVMTVPSLGALASRCMTDVMPPPPGIFWTMTSGLPGKYSPRIGAIARA
jgi:hypothetical protein